MGIEALPGRQVLQRRRSLIRAGSQQGCHSTRTVDSIGPASYVGGALIATGRNSRSWKSKLKSVSGETAAIRTSSIFPSGFSMKATYASAFRVRSFQRATKVLYCPCSKSPARSGVWAK